VVVFERGTDIGICVQVVVGMHDGFGWCRQVSRGRVVDSRRRRLALRRRRAEERRV